MSDFIILTKANTANKIRFMVNLDFVVQIEPYTGSQIQDKEAKTRIVMSFPDSKNSQKLEVTYVQESYEEIENMITPETEGHRLHR